MSISNYSSYCTLFDKNYLDKGIVTIDSLIRFDLKGSIYILAMDQESFAILNDYYTDNKSIIIIPLEIFLDDNLKKVQDERSRAEFCWTCTASLIYYVLTVYNEDMCTYIDADMYFYSNPDKLVDEMLLAGKSVLIVEHRFKNDFFGKRSIQTAGKYNVAFNTFQKSEESLLVLKEWKNNTIESCFSYSNGNTSLGDQYYLSAWPEKYDCVHILKNNGADIAPWNLYRYKLVGSDGTIPILSFDGKGEVPAVFFHFHNIQYYSRETVDINVYKYQLKADRQTAEAFYYPYLVRIDQTKSMLEEKYGFYPIILQHPGLVEVSISKKDYLRKLFSKQIAFRIVVSIRNRIAARNAKYDIYDINKIIEYNKLQGADKCI